MTFYLTPSDGTISTALLQSYTECRLKYLAGLRKYENGLQLPEHLFPYADSLIEGTPKDRVSHFALRYHHPNLHTILINTP